LRQEPVVLGEGDEQHTVEYLLTDADGLHVVDAFLFFLDVGDQRFAQQPIVGIELFGNFLVGGLALLE